MAVRELKPVYKVEEAAKELRVSTPTIWRKINCGEIKIVKIGSRVVIRGIDLDDYLSSLAEIKGVEDGE